jgi:4-diphosphocytidyl-2-C-methyl-D-erythritol kinase
MLCFPNAKINLGLYITNKRDDGYHDLETVFYPVALRDVLEIVPAREKGEMHLSGLAVDGDIWANLVWKAYELLKDAHPDKVTPLDIYLHKVIPMGSGLGGGSADAAFMLRLVNDYCKLDLDDEQLAAFALQLGSDCPFFIYNTPQLAKGRGELMEPAAIDLSAYRIVIVCPELHVSTAKAFSSITPHPAAFDLSGLSELPLAKWKEHIANDFERPVFAQHPELGAIKEQLYQQGAIYASLSGSGSAIYGIFEPGKKVAIQSSLSHRIFELGEAGKV